MKFDCIMTVRDLTLQSIFEQRRLRNCTPPTLPQVDAQPCVIFGCSRIENPLKDIQPTQGSGKKMETQYKELAEK